ncbi:MAG: proteasome assembly chaperone 4 family protein [Candidatus Thorarchaeota archaeon]
MDLQSIQEFSENTPTGKTLFFRVIRMDNGLLVMISDTETFRFGATVFSVPSKPGQREPTSTAMSGTGQDIMIARALAERVSAWTGSMCMLIMSVKDMDRQTMLEASHVLKNHFVT